MEPRLNFDREMDMSSLFSILVLVLRLSIKIKIFNLRRKFSSNHRFVVCENNNFDRDGDVSNLSSDSRKFDKISHSYSGKNNENKESPQRSSYAMILIRNNGRQRNSNGRKQLFWRMKANKNIIYCPIC